MTQRDVNNGTDSPPSADGRTRGAKRFVPFVLVVCAGFVIFWEIMASRSSRPFGAFKLTAAAFSEFRPRSTDWSVRAASLAADHPSAPNIFAFRLSAASSAAPVTVRLVHGYNMPDCMKLKHYTVDQVRDARQEPGVAVQIWRLTSDIGDRSIWVTSMLRESDFGDTDIDIRSMAFPRIASADDADWSPRGITIESLAHPVKNFGRFARKRWNNSRCDLATFLRLRRPAWASGEVLTLVSASQALSHEASEDEAVKRVLAAHSFMREQLRSQEAGVRRQESGGKGKVSYSYTYSYTPISSMQSSSGTSID